MFSIDTGDTSEPIRAISAVADDTMNIRFTSWARADRSKRKVIAAIEEHECPEALAEYMQAESLVIDALFLFDPSMSADIETAFEDHKSILRTGLASLENAAAPAPTPASAQPNVLNKTF